VSYAFAGSGLATWSPTRCEVRRWVKLKGLLPGKRTALCMVPNDLKSDHGWYRQSLRRLLDMALGRRYPSRGRRGVSLKPGSRAHGGSERQEITGQGRPHHEPANDLTPLGIGPRATVAAKGREERTQPLHSENIMIGRLRP